MLHKYDHLISKYHCRFFDERLASIGLSGPIGRYLIDIDLPKTIKMNVLIEKSPFHKSHATRAICHLSNLGYIIKTIDPSDARGYVLSITKQGEIAAKAVYETLKAWDKLEESALTEEEITAMKAIAKKIYRKIAAYYGEELLYEENL
ncbi:MAG: MarR family winged helix-turn-helix transcriptional regulator [Candidatus Izemoplasmatales bacterium]|nr:MarR family winged helix-turn-helix transcriptional regulator [Candidatus Izemoplasmatales bacterium]MDD3865339.1 MarR family winged helix-turn-helix transcriptional regulator [Candidatus Izemoplasmatales bacterium]